MFWLQVICWSDSRIAMSSGKHAVFTDIPENCISFTVWDCLTLKMKALPSIETSVTMYRMTRRNKPENVNIQDMLSVVFLFFCLTSITSALEFVLVVLL
jgi:hypothetical protein